MSTPLVSVNMCVWRPHEVYFPQAVRSILDQTFDDFELIIVEDPSETDGRAMIADLLGDPRIRYVQNQNRTSFCRQKNLALTLSRAPLVAMMDADDVAEPERLEKQYQFLERNPSIAVLGTSLRIIDAQGNTIGFRSYPTSPVAVRKSLRRYNPIAHPSVMVRRDIIQSCGAYRDETFLAEDYDLWIRVMKSGHDLCSCPEYLLRYRVHTGAAKWAKLRQILKMTIYVKRQYFANEFDLGDRLRLASERLLLLLPSQWVYWLFCAITYRRNRTRTPKGERLVESSPDCD